MASVAALWGEEGQEQVASPSLAYPIIEAALLVCPMQQLVVAELDFVP